MTDGYSDKERSNNVMLSDHNFQWRLYIAAGYMHGSLFSVRPTCHGRFVGPVFSIVVHPVFYHFTTLLAFVAPTSSRLSQLRSLTPVCLGPPEDCKLRSRSRDVILRKSSEL